jgi:hypothetical protein
LDVRKRGYVVIIIPNFELEMNKSGVLITGVESSEDYEYFLELL